MLEPTDAQIKLPEPAFVSALGLEILRLKKERERERFALIAGGDQTLLVDEAECTQRHIQVQSFLEPVFINYSLSHCCNIGSWRTSL